MNRKLRNAIIALNTIREYCARHDCESCEIKSYCNDYFGLDFEPQDWDIPDTESLEADMKERNTKQGIKTFRQEEFKWRNLSQKTGEGNALKRGMEDLQKAMEFIGKMIDRMEEEK